MDQTARAAALARERLAGGARLGELLREWFADERVHAMSVLMRIADLNVIEGRRIVMDAQRGAAFDHVGLAELEHLARVLKLDRDHAWLRGHLRDAIMEGRPWRLFVPARDEPSWTTRYYAAQTIDPSFDARTSTTLEELRAGARAAREDPQWKGELRIERDEPELILLHFPLVTAA